MGEIIECLKKILLSIFCVLNVIDMAQTVTFLRVGIESNPFAVAYPQLWFPFKAIMAFGFPIGLYKLDSYLKTKEEEGIYEFLNSLMGILYIVVLFADFVYFLIVRTNMLILGRLV